MFSSLIILLAVMLEKNSKASLLSKTNLTTPYLVQKAGYPIEVHQVTTEDGYILTLHRIPYSPKRQKLTTKQNTNSPVAIMMHGIIACSTDWIGAGKDVALGYLLADEGFDVWLGNSRGNRYSQKHIELDAEMAEFWNFSYHEMGIYDLPAIFHYVYNETGIKRFHYFGHSQGTTEMFVLCSTFPEYNEWIIAAYLLAPLAYTEHLRTPLAKIFGPLFGHPESPLDFNLLPNLELIHVIAAFFCNDYSIFQWICDDVVDFTAGGSNYFNVSLIPMLTEIYPAGSSAKQFEHYLQNYESHHFRPFDYGNDTNMKFYNSSKPADYNLSNIIAPLYLYYGENDFFAEQSDILHFIGSLKTLDVLEGVYQVPVEKWNHVDFLYGMDLKELLNDRVIADVNRSL